MSTVSEQESAFNRVPPDIWRVIFRLCVAEDAKSFKTLAFKSRKAPLRLCRVCSPWRKIAVGAPELWCNIEFRVNGIGQGFPRYPLIVEALARAGGMPLTIVLRGTTSNHQYDPTTSRAAETVELLLASLPRTKHLKLDCRALEHVFFLRIFNDSGGRQQFKNILDGAPGAPLLETLQISGHPAFTSFPNAGSHSDTSISKLWTPSPRLHTMVLHGDHLLFRGSWITMLIPAPRQLTVLEIEFATAAADLLNILFEMRSLISCTAQQLVGRLPANTKEKAPVLLPFLQDLDIAAYGEVISLTDFLARIQTPSLVSLHLKRERKWSRTSFLTFLQNSCCSILCLTLIIDDPEGDHKIACLELLPNLKTLSIHPYRDDDYFSEELADALLKWDQSKKEFFICPNLERIDISFDFIFDHFATKTEFSDMVETRFRIGFLKRISVREVRGEDSRRFQHGTISFEMLRLLILARDGLTVELHPEPSWRILFR